MISRDSRQAFIDHVFLCELVFQAELAALAGSRLPPVQGSLDSTETWSAIQSVLISAGNVSKILRPSGKRYGERGRRLRLLLQIEDGSPLLSRELRNHFEHYDERIEDWLRTTGGASFTDQAIGPLTGYLRDFPQTVQRHYDPTTCELSFRGHSLHLGKVLEALAELRKRCLATTFL